ncbi:TetR/AcrR family transcriptional regulator [Haloglycomyces albus]|uniref:TetR/AcrR family transcriptional regulator n=1 Tax=Haloglycomyces albus TaxID=526067 RepID=UPI0004B495E5|nr:TetR/AcrR family transcriptional regulator [Haloglycomyces albus]
MTEDIPDGIARLWRIPTESRRGRPARLNVDTVISTAVELADREGIETVTLPKVSDKLGVTKMSLYRYVGSKDELVTLMQDYAYGPAPHVETDSWKTGLREWVWAQIRLFERHPWLVRLPVTGPPEGPHGIDWLDTALRHLSQTSLSLPDQLAVTVLLSGFVRNSVQTMHDMDGKRHTDGVDLAESERRWVTAMSTLVNSQRYPYASQIFDTMALPESTADDERYSELEFGLNVLLNGLAATINSGTVSER